MIDKIPPTPQLNVELMVNGAMKMREAVDAIIKEFYTQAKTPEEIAILDDLKNVIESQQGMIDFQIEKYIQLSELMDQTYDLLNNFVEGRKKS